MAELKKTETIEVQGTLGAFKYPKSLTFAFQGDGDEGLRYLSFRELPNEVNNFKEGDWVATSGIRSTGVGKALGVTLNVIKIHKHSPLKDAPMVEKKPEIVVEGGVSVPDQKPPLVVAETDEKGIVPIKVKEGIAPFVHMLVPVDKIVETFKKFKEVKAKILEEDDFLYVDKSGTWHNNKPGSGVVNEYIKKTGWQKLALAFSLDIELLSKIRHTGKDKHGEYYVWTHRYRISHPSGKFVITEGSCSSRDSFFGKKHGEIIEPLESDIMHTSQTVSVNRGISMLLGGGVSAEEMMKQKE